MLCSYLSRSRSKLLGADWADAFIDLLDFARDFFPREDIVDWGAGHLKRTCLLVRHQVRRVEPSIRSIDSSPIQQKGLRV